MVTIVEDIDIRYDFRQTKSMEAIFTIKKPQAMTE
jgi:hypothetical protein